MLLETEATLAADEASSSCGGSEPEVDTGALEQQQQQQPGRVEHAPITTVASVVAFDTESVVACTSESTPETPIPFTLHMDSSGSNSTG
eukprot:UC1_evm1s1939